MWYLDEMAWRDSRRGHMLDYTRLHRNSPHNFLGTSSCILLLCHKEMHEERVQRLWNKEWKPTHHAAHVYSISMHIHFQYTWSALKEQLHIQKWLQSTRVKSASCNFALLQQFFFLFSFLLTAISTGHFIQNSINSWLKTFNHIN